mmetsp:Transcript_65518/g.213333  ORF Transcript_65518/g.213333 Transcript_65518/m.213333 type:complete len:220 (+) Transcript_65518:275-934(+)
MVALGLAGQLRDEFEGRGPANRHPNDTGLLLQASCRLLCTDRAHWGAVRDDDHDRVGILPAIHQLALGLGECHRCQGRRSRVLHLFDPSSDGRRVIGEVRDPPDLAILRQIWSSRTLSNTSALLISTPSLGTAEELECHFDLVIAADHSIDQLLRQTFGLRPPILTKAAAAVQHHDDIHLGDTLQGRSVRARQHALARVHVAVLTQDRQPEDIDFGEEP